MSVFRGRAKRRRKAASMELNLVAMIDVVFLLLIYFMLSVSFSLGEEIYRLDMPDPFGAGAPDPFDLPEHPLTIHVNSGPGETSYQLSLDIDLVDPIDTFEELFVFLDAHQVRPEQPRGLFSADVPINITPTAETRWEHAVEVLNACVRAGYTNVQLVDPQ